MIDSDINQNLSRLSIVIGDVDRLATQKPPEPLKLVGSNGLSPSFPNMTYNNQPSGLDL
jgi:hypothetical protein